MDNFPEAGTTIRKIFEEIYKTHRDIIVIQIIIVVWLFILTTYLLIKEF